MRRQSCSISRELRRELRRWRCMDGDAAIDPREPFAVPENDRLDVVPVASDDSRRADRSADQVEVIRVDEY